MQKIDEPEVSEADNSKYIKWIFYILIFLGIVIFKFVAKKEIRENTIENGLNGNYENK